MLRQYSYLPQEKYRVTGGYMQNDQTARKPKYADAALSYHTEKQILVLDSEVEEREADD